MSEKSKKEKPRGEKNDDETPAEEEKARPESGYYYDDAYGYTVYVPEEDEADDD